MPNKVNQREKQQHKEEEAKSQIVDAIRHVGPTLESEGRYDDVLGKELASPESQVQAADESDVLSTRTIEEGRHHLTERAIEPQPLKTHLPGDTSSDPHTDVGPDNATTAHARTEEDEEIPPQRKAS